MSSGVPDPDRIEVYRKEHPPDSPRRGHGLRPRAKAILDGLEFDGRDVLDIGTGRGRLAFLLAPRCRNVLGIDIDPKKVRIADSKAREKGITNVRFMVADAESTDLRKAFPSLGVIVANLCMSLEMVRGAGAALPVAGEFVFTSFHTEQWKETGAGSSHALDPKAVMDAAHASGLELQRGLVEVDVYRFSSVDSMRDLYLRQGSRGRKWDHDGRLAGLMMHAQQVRPEVTEAYFTAYFSKCSNPASR